MKRPLRRAVKRRLEPSLFRSRRARRAYVAARWPWLHSTLPDLSHLALFEEVARGPLMRDEALLLHSVTRVVRPQTVVEVGFLRGHGSLNLLAALDADARLFAFDINPDCEQRARDRFGRDARLKFRVRSQDAISADDVDGRPVDLVFLDASHDLELNQRTLARLMPLLAPRAIVAIHDTGTMPLRLIPAGHWFHQQPERWVGEDAEVEPGERAFVNWVLETHPEFAQMHFHSSRTLRCGLTFLQRSEPLARPA